jgi:hypothetical protein
MKSELASTYPLPSSSAPEPATQGSTRRATISASSIVTPMKQATPNKDVSNRKPSSQPFKRGGAGTVFRSTPPSSNKKRPQPDSESSSEASESNSIDLDSPLAHCTLTKRRSTTLSQPIKNFSEDKSSKEVVDTVKDEQENDESATPAMSQGSVRRSQSDQKDMSEDPYRY